jgi:hypothetical protein
MNTFSDEIREINTEIKGLKIFKDKQASLLRTEKQFFSVDFVLKWNSSFNQPASDYMNFTANTNSYDITPMASVAIEEDDLQDREIVSYCSPAIGNELIHIPARCLLYFRVISNNASDIAATQGGGTKTITLNFSITGTSRFEIVPDNG